MEKKWYEKTVTELFGSEEAIADSRASEEKQSSKYLAYERILIDLNSTLPADLYFRTRYTTYGYDLYIYSLPKQAQYEMHIDLEHGLALNDDQQVLCKLDDIKEYLLNAGITTEDTSDDFEHDEFNVDANAISAFVGGSDEQ